MTCASTRICSATAQTPNAWPRARQASAASCAAGMASLGLSRSRLKEAMAISSRAAALESRASRAASRASLAACRPAGTSWSRASATARACSAAASVFLPPSTRYSESASSAERLASAGRFLRPWMRDSVSSAAASILRSCTSRSSAHASVAPCRAASGMADGHLAASTSTSARQSSIMAAPRRSPCSLHDCSFGPASSRAFFVLISARSSPPYSIGFHLASSACSL
mmetsp:Transcript_82393/g.223258  ORF Transcript_82393/g.223258 Transcript_82393/m.223258 type:complete len:227 (-) Transcript_82393:595-1275(-)